MARRRTRVHQRVHDYFLPHRGNRYQPGIFGWKSVATIIGCAVLLIGIYAFATAPGFRGSSFASVLPAALTAFTNEDRAANSLPGLESDPLLAKAAQMKADDMAAKGYFAHVSPDGTTPWHWLDAVGYKYSYAGENLAVDFVDSKDVEVAWMNSPTHRANIVKPDYTKIGIGVADGMYEGHETTFVVQFFAAAPQAVEASTHVSAAPSTDPRVLGAESSAAAAVPAAPHTILTIAGRVTTAPSHALAAILGGLLVLVLILLGIMLAVHAHVRARAIEAATGGVVLACVIGSCLYYTLSNGTVVLPSDSQSASVAQTF